VLVFWRETQDRWQGSRGGRLERLGGLPQRLLWDRQAGIHGHAGRPTDAFAAFCGQLRVDWGFCEPADPQTNGAVERLRGYAERNFEPGRRFANEIDYQDQLDAWFSKVNAARTRRLGRPEGKIRLRPMRRPPAG